MALPASYPQGSVTIQTQSALGLETQTSLICQSPVDSGDIKGSFPGWD